MTEEIIEKLATLVDKEGGKAYYVGGYVRDLLLGKKSKDIDIEVHGVSENTLKEILRKVGKPLEYGKDFGIYSLEGTNIDIALPRVETKTGEGHRDFEVEVKPDISLKDACRRRDFTINSMMIDILTNELIDPFNGEEDLNDRILKHIDDETFVEDPLRVFRAAQFASRFNLKIDDATIELCKTMDETKLSKERVEEELKKALLQSEKPSIFFEYLAKMNKLDYWFKEVKECIGYEQNPNKHPEGDVFTHTMMALDEGALYRNMVSDSYYFMLLLLVHDFGKLRTKVMTEEGIHFYGHENYLDDIKIFLDRLISSNDTKEYVLEMVPKHMRGHKIFSYKLNEYESNLWFSNVKHPKDLVYIATSDKSNHRDPNRIAFLLNRYTIFEYINSKEQVTGKDLINNGIKPGDRFSEYLDYAYDLKLQGIEKEDALKATLQYIKEN
ncbi:MAG: hypothetical protein Q4F12_02505 [Erysipelotrichaceae bacterium]|nr:hypothetical protein [Erysipelotrichaceae bacterium]